MLVLHNSAPSGWVRDEVIIFSVNNSEGGTLCKGSMLSSLFVLVLLATLLFDYKASKLVIGGFTSRLFPGGSLEVEASVCL